MVQSPSWEANWFAASQEIPCISRNPKVHYRTHKCPPPSPTLGQLNPVHIHTSHLLEIHPNIIHPSTPRSHQWPPSLWFPHQDRIQSLSSTIRATCPAHLILFDFTTHTIVGEGYKSFSTSLCNFLHPPVTSSLIGPNILLNTMFSNTLNFLSSRNVNDQVLHPYKTTGKIIVKLVHLVGFIIRMFHDARPPERQKHVPCVLLFLLQPTNAQLFRKRVCYNSFLHNLYSRRAVGYNNTAECRLHKRLLWLIKR